jgi:hypothetical protein
MGKKPDPNDNIKKKSEKIVRCPNGVIKVFDIVEYKHSNHSAKGVIKQSLRTILKGGQAIAFVEKLKKEQKKEEEENGKKRKSENNKNTKDSDSKA